MAQHSDRTVSIFELVESVKRHKIAGLLVFVIVLAIFVLAWLYLPREYGSEGRLVVRMGRANLGMNTAPDGARTVSIQDTRETEIRSVTDLVKSEQVLGAVVDSIGAEEILANTLQLPEIFSFGGGSTGDMSDEQYEALRLREKAIQRLSKRLNVDHEKKSANISVFCTGASPTLAQKIVAELMQVVQETHVRVHSANRSASHFDRGLAEKEATLKKCQQDLEQFATDNNFLSIDDARATLNGVIDKLENEMVDAGLDLRQSLAMVAELQSQATKIEVELDLPTMGIERSATAGARTQFYQRIGEKAKLMAMYNANHPKIDQINAEIERLRKEVEALPEERVQRDKIRNPVYEQLKVSLVKEMAVAEAKQERLEEVKAKMQENQVRLQEYNHLKTRAFELQRRIQLAQMEFDTYAKKRNESRMVDQLDKEAISDIVIQQPACLILKKVSPKGSLLIPLGMFLGAVCGIATCIFADRRNLAELTTPEEIEEALGIPVMATLPRVHSSRVLIN